MIIDKIENAHLYSGLSANLKTAFEFLTTTDFSKLEDGKIIIAGEKIWANLQSYPTKVEETTPWEIHRRYIDIQFMIDGEELMGWTNLDNYTENTDFDTEKDISFGDVEKANAQFIKVPNKYFIVFTPEDAHKPALQLETQKNVRKIIVKVEA